MGVLSLSVGIDLMPLPSGLVGLSGSRGIQPVTNTLGSTADGSTSSNCVVNPTAILMGIQILPTGSVTVPATHQQAHWADIIGVYSSNFNKSSPVV